MRDYSKKPESADPIHPAIGGDSDKGERTSDVCLSLPMKTGGTSRAVFLVEQQHEKDESLPLRMFQSYYRASDEYASPVTSLAIFTGQSKPMDTYTRNWQGTSVSFTYNTYSVSEADVEELKRDKRVFAIPVLAGKRMLEASGKPSERGAYSLELLDLTEARGLEPGKAWWLKNFIHRILRINDKDIDPKVKEVWKMKFRPIDEVIREINIRDAREAGKEEGKEEGKKEKALEIARNFLSNGVSPDIIVKSTGVSLEDIRGL
jgi:hypothetical protein